MKNQLLILGICILCLLGSCGGKRNKPTDGIGNPELQLYVFDVGEILIKDISILNSDESGSKLLTNSSYLIRHKKGDLIWDTGFPDSLAILPDGMDSEMATIKMSETLESQLTKIGLSPGDIEYLALSHLHPDHVGNSNLFNEATVLLQQEEYDSLFNNGVVTPDVIELVDNPFVKLKGDHDVFGDGSVIIKRATGHTSGHQVLFLNLPETGPIVLSGDLFITSKQRATKGVPMFNVSESQTLVAMNEIEAFILEKKATLWIQHDPDQNQEILRSPNFYE